jgi:hypothetical protein
VASLHILRQASLDPDDQAFLLQHAGHLSSLDLLRWWSRCERGRTGAVLGAIAQAAVDDPGRFKHEILGAPRLDMDDDEWTELRDLLRGKVPEDVWRLLERGRRGDERPADAAPLAAEAALRPASDASTTEGLEDLLDGLDDGVPMAEAVAAGGAAPPPEPRYDEVLERARATSSHEERATLLGWLEEHGAPRKALMELTLQTLRSPGAPQSVLDWMARSWLARQLATRAAWERHGEDVLRALFERRAWTEMSDFIALAWTEAARADEAPRGYLGAVQLAFGSVLVGAVRIAIEEGREADAMAALSALLCLDPPSRLSASLHALRKLPGLGGEALELCALNERLVKHGRGRDASLEDVIAAVHALADALG